MQLTCLHGYPDKIGRRFAFSAYGNGPKSYTNTGTNATSGDIVSPAGLGFNRYIDCLIGDLSVSGTYYVHAQSAGVGARQTWRLRWFVTSTNAEVANGVDLSAEQVQVSGFGGDY